MSWSIVPQHDMALLLFEELKGIEKDALHAVWVCFLGLLGTSRR